MQFGLIFISFFLIFKAGKKPDQQQSFDKGGYYQVMASGNLAAIDSELVIIDHALPKEKEAYIGALQMRRAGLLRFPKDKLRTFRLGAIKLETALDKDSSNAEYHFLRLIIQEHAPALLHYNRDKENDCQHIYRSFKNLPPPVQKAITDYSKSSKLLRVERITGQ